MKWQTKALINTRDMRKHAALIAKLEKRFSPEFSRLLAKRVMNTPSGFATKALFRVHTDKHPLNNYSTNYFNDVNGIEHVRQVRVAALNRKQKP